MNVEQVVSRPAWRPRFRFSLSTLFILVTAMAVLVVVAMAMLGWPNRGSLSPALIRISRQPPGLSTAAGVPSFSEEEFRVYRDTQIALIKSQFVAEAALRKPTIKNLPIVQHQSDAVGWLQENLTVEAVDDSEIVRISFADGPAADRAAIVNTVVEAYVDEIVNAERMEVARNRDVLEKRFAHYRNELRTVAEKFDTRADQSNEAQDAIEQEELEHLRDTIKQLRSRLTELETLIELRPRVQPIEDARAR